MNITTALVQSVLRSWRAYEWTVQGFGFVRTKIADVGRIHVWDSRLTVPLVSTIHTHPWALRSTIISGELINCRFLFDTESKLDRAELPYMRSRLKTGEGGGLVGEPEALFLLPKVPEIYTAGESYNQHRDEIHRTIAQDGTVTLLERDQGPPLEEAFTYWPQGGAWVSAEPKPVEPWQLEMVIKHALALWVPR